MDDCIKKLEQLTEDMLVRLDSASYEELEIFVDNRQKLIDHIILEQDKPCVPTEMQRQRIRVLMESDPLIQARMNALRMEAKDWLINRNQAKVQRNTYEKDYFPDSILMDKRK